MADAHVNGINLHYDLHGRGGPLLFINGLGQPSISWEPELISAMAATHQFITFDNRGTTSDLRVVFGDAPSRSARATRGAGAKEDRHFRRSFR